MGKNYTAAEIAEAIKITAEVCGSELSDGAVSAMLLHLKPYGGEAVMSALSECQREAKGRLTLAAVLEKLENCDGRPGAEEAWGMIAHALTDESDTVVWTEEMALSAGVASDLIELGDKVGARMAFRENYERLVRQAREAKHPIRWSVSPGTDSQRRTDALMLAVQQGKLAQQQVAHMLPYDATQERHKMLTGQAMSLEDKRKAKEALAKISGMLTVKNIEDES